MGVSFACLQRSALRECRDSPASTVLLFGGLLSFEFLPFVGIIRNLLQGAFACRDFFGLWRLSYELQSELDFLWARQTLINAFVKELDAAFVIRARVEFRQRHQFLGLFDDQGAVHEEKGLLRNGGLMTPATGPVGVREIE